MSNEITPEKMRREIVEKQKNVDRNVDFLLGYARQQGWKSSLTRIGTTYRVLLWNVMADGRGEAGDEPPIELAVGNPDEEMRKVMEENRGLKARIEGLERDVSAARSVAAEARATGAEFGGPAIGGLNVKETIIG